MLSENIVKFFKKNGVLLAQITILLLPIVIISVEYASMNKNTDNLDEVAHLEKIETILAAEGGVAQPVAQPANEKKEDAQPNNVSTFEIDEVGLEMLNETANNPTKMLEGSGACTNFENVHTLAKHTGTISKSKNTEHFKKPLPAIITETEYTCTDATGTKKIKSTTMGVGVDAEANMLRCVQSNSDEAMDSDARFKHVVKIMTHHCGFKLAELRPISNAIPTGKQP
ncbi:MAG: hypothetical protein WCL34_14240 [Methylococcaceae bacterium]